MLAERFLRAGGYRRAQLGGNRASRRALNHARSATACRCASRHHLHAAGGWMIGSNGWIRLGATNLILLGLVRSDVVG